MESQLPYWISNTSIIFKPKFNEPLVNYIQIISQHNKLIFSNYDNLDIYLEINNEYDEKHYNSHKGSQFNKELNNLPKLLEYLELNKNYDKKIMTVYTNLKTLSCSKNYKYIGKFDNDVNIIKID